MQVRRVQRPLPPAARGPAAGWPCCCSTSTSSAASTTRSATPSATGCSVRWPTGCARRSARTAWSPALGGDEFAVLAPRLADHAAAGVLAERVADALDRAGHAGRLPLDVTAVDRRRPPPRPRLRHATLLRHAEVAMYDAKDRDAAYAIYTPESDQNSVERLELLADLRRALEMGRRDEISLFYQPQIEMATGEVVGVEALLRWHHPTRGHGQPAAADQGGRAHRGDAAAHPAGHRGRDRAAGQVAGPGPPCGSSINVSVRDLHRPELVDQIEELLDRPRRRSPTRSSWRSPRAR